MIEYVVVYDTVSGALQWKTNGPQGFGAAQQVPEGMAVMVLPFEAFVALPDDLTPLKRAVADQVNVGAGNFRKLYITDVPGQLASYQNKEAEARKWVSGADPATAPYLAAEAAATDVTIDALAAVVVQTANAWRAIDVKVEARRRQAAVEIIAATNISAIVAAGLVDWPALTA